MSERVECDDVEVDKRRIYLAIESFIATFDVDDMASPTNTDHDQAPRPPEPPAIDLATLHDTLDTLLTHYLTLLHHYHSAQQDLQRHLSSAFLSLAQANFKSPHRSRRYGRDFYDERMKAGRVCQFDAAQEEGVKLSLGTVEPIPSATDSDDKAEDEGQPQQEPSPPATPEPQTQHPSPPKTSEETFDRNEAQHDAKDDFPRTPPDPLHWFGILVPRELRTAQASFTSALAGSDQGGKDGAVVRAANAARAMRELEIEIGRCRKGIRKVEAKGRERVEAKGRPA
ncbi:hypothetical protein Tdes44962_MAKER09215 [Teratosphaeria destructans]|uniref:Vacuolar ATPase assembly protein VMA22 n=1 Tax=Teratosphaeria destructans TaxID=418781 RepID=A0A9W7W3B6_9PEZI|nr:hypothetical protein Tdes44962_MAKER09215 [Teratosphaeria destructans]